MSVTISDKVISKSGLSEQAFRIELAIYLFQKYLLTFGQASDFAELSQYDFQQELGKRDIFIHYDEEDLEEDLKNLASLRK
jgi:predicted HTH domain antitoxin